jgi:membrane-bound lytic murein transglycosylase B
VKKLRAAVDTRFVDSVFADPRCTIDSSLLARSRGGGYAFLFSDSSKERGKRFFIEKRTLLDSITSAYRVPGHILAAIYRTETDFGNSLGRHIVLRALFTRYITRTTERARAEEYRQLVAFLSLAHEKGWDVFSIIGSSAGAFGRTQFRPTSYRFAVDGNGDGVVDLFNEHDALASTANFLVRQGWSATKQRATLVRYNRGGYARAVLQYAAIISDS